jgi:hypothetical protein
VVVFLLSSHFCHRLQSTYRIGVGLIFAVLDLYDENSTMALILDLLIALSAVSLVSSLATVRLATCVPSFGSSCTGQICLGACTVHVAALSMLGSSMIDNDRLDELKGLAALVSVAAYAAMLL